MSRTATTILWQFGPMIYLPTVLFSFGQGALMPLLPTLSAKLGADLATAALVTTTLVIGQLCGNIPASAIITQITERIIMIGSGILGIFGLVGVAFAPNLPLLTLAVFVIGLAASGFGVARHCFLTIHVPKEFRARALSLLSGSTHFGQFTGPFMSAGLIAWSGSEYASVWFFIGCLIFTILLIFFGPDPEKRINLQESPAAITDPTDTSDGVFKTMWTHRGVLVRLGSPTAILAALRAVRQSVLPLWGMAIELDAQTVAIVVGTAGVLDFGLFYVSGFLMDRFGRIWACLPSMLLLGCSLVALSLTLNLDTARFWYFGIAILIGIGNGVSSGVIITLGSDVAPQQNPAPFLGSWRTLVNLGGAVAPLLISAVTAVSSISIATLILGVLGPLGAIGFLRWIPRYIPTETNKPSQAT